MNKTDAAYLAGLIDGEGSIGVMKITRKNRPSYLFMSRIVICMTSENLINWIKSITGLGSVNEKPVPFGRKKQWQWMVNSQDAFTVLKIVLPYLKLKKKQANNSIEFQSKLRTSGKRTALSLSERKIRLKYYRKSRKLNGGKTRGGFRKNYTMDSLY